METTTPLTVTGLRNKNLPPKLRRFCERLKDNDPTLTDLTLFKNSFDEDGAVAFCDALSRNSELRRLALREVRISSQESIDILSQGLMGNMSLDCLSFREVNIGNVVAATVSNHVLANNSSCLTRLFLCNSDVGDDGAIAIAKGLETNTTLRCLGLEQNNIGSGGTQALGNALKRNTTLDALQVDFNGINDDGAEFLFDALQHNDSLHTLSLNRNNIGDDGALALKSLLRLNTNLEFIDIGGNKITNHGAIEVAKGIKDNKSLTHLDLFGNHMGEEGLEAFKEALQNHNRSIKHLVVGFQFNLEELHEKPENQKREELIRFYCELNRSGRQFIGDCNIPWSLWPLIFARLKSKYCQKYQPESQLFWFLREKSEIFQRVMESPHQSHERGNGNSTTRSK